jgi:hypothetical protein
VEPWVPEIDTDLLEIDAQDPDRPFSDVALTKKNPTKQERTGRASIHLATSPRCERVLKAEYYQDSSPDGMHLYLAGVPNIIIPRFSTSLHRPLVLRLR